MNVIFLSKLYFKHAIVSTYRPFICLLSINVCLLLSGCAGLANHAPEETKGSAQLTPVSPSYRALLNLPEPAGRITVAVYGVRDQTGQYKPSPDSNFSTAVTQGASSMLVKVLRDSKWFLPVERESLQNLLTERKIINALEQRNHPNKSNPPSSTATSLPSLIPASLIIEGGIVSYENNTRSGGIGLKYFGTGFSKQYRMDQVTVNLRVVNVRTGEILASVMTTKTIYSQEFSPSTYRYVRFQRLLEAEMGYTTNEPSDLCVQEALESAVIHLIIQGVQDKFWNLKNPQDIHAPLLQDYIRERSSQTSIVQNVIDKQFIQELPQSN